MVPSTCLKDNQIVSNKKKSFRLIHKKKKKIIAKTKRKNRKTSTKNDNERIKIC